MLHASHNPALVVLSIVVACIASYAALQLAGRIVAGRRIRVPWLLGSAFTMGIGIWSMHFVAMLAFRVDVPVTYAINLVVLSALVAIAASLLAFMIVSRPMPRPVTLVVAALFMGPAIAGMHYIGMAAMRMPAAIHYDRGLVALSVVIAVTASLAALRLFIEFRDDRVLRPAWRKPASAVLMGAAVSGMHYTGMRAAHFVSLGGPAPDGRGFIATDALAYSVGLSASVIAGIAVLAVLLDRSVRAKAAETTEIRRGAEALRVSQERLRFALAAARMRTWELDLAQEFILRTDAAEPSFSRPVPWADALQRVHAEDRAAVDQAVRLGGREGRLDVDFRIITRAGETRWLNAKGHRPDTGGHQESRLVGVTIDITARRQLEEQLRQAQKMEAIGQLAGGIAHDFNNLLTVITGNTQMSLDGMADGDPTRGTAQEVLAASERAASLTRQLLAFSRRQLMQPQPVDLNEIVASLQPMLQRLIGEDVIIETRFERPSVVAVADPGQLEQILMNLAVNARDAMPSGGMLRIETAHTPRPFPPGAVDGAVAPGAFVTLTVSDTGIGIDPAIQSRVFEPFFTTKEPSRGTGLGLSTVYGIVKQSGGYVFVASESGNGSIFTIHLRRAVLPAAQAVPVADTPAVRTGSETILLVEDEEGVRTLARRILTRQGYNIIDAGSGGAALELAGRYEGAIDLLLTDVVMPGMSGGQLAERLLAGRPATRVLYMSGYTSDRVFHHGLSGREVAFLPKPFDSKALAAAVRAALDGPLAAGVRPHTG